MYVALSKMEKVGESIHNKVYDFIKGRFVDKDSVSDNFNAKNMQHIDMQFLMDKGNL